jgi:DNA-binding NarL/FixJ family response regulator
MSAIRIMVVDDFEHWRSFVLSKLEKVPGLRVISEVADGLDAVQKAEALRPDLVLLDIGLPRLDGMDAARQILKLSPESKILFLSQESDSDVVQEALRIGARGYILKAHAGNELLSAVNTVIQGEQYLSCKLPGVSSSGLADLHD